MKTAILVNGTDHSAVPVYTTEDDDFKTAKPASIDTSKAEGAATDDDDLFNPERLRLKQDFADDLGVKAILTVPVRKSPNKQVYFRVHPAPEYRFEPLALLELSEERETYLVERDLAEQLGKEVFGARLFTCIDRSGSLFLWRVKMATDGRVNDWSSSACRIAQMAMAQWVRIQAGKSCYEPLLPTSKIPDPIWPEISRTELLKAAFKDRFIRALNHPVLQQLRGEI
jgi:hypothetical protein